MKARERWAIALWVVFVLGALGLAVVANPVWFAVSGMAAVTLFLSARQLLSADH